MHSLLKRQLARLVGEREVPAEWRSFIDAVDEAYRAFDADYAMLERSLDLSSQELVEANSQMRAICNAIPDLVLHLDSTGVILDARGNVADPVLGGAACSRGRKVDETPLRGIASESNLGIARAAPEKNRATIELTVDQAGDQVHCEARLVPLADGQILAIVRDISERKRAERANAALLERVRQFNAELELRVAERTEALRQQEALFHGAADQAPQVMWIVNPKGAVTYLNRYWYDLVGGAPPKWLGHEWMDAVLPADAAQMREKWQAVKDTGELFSGTRRVRAVDGTVHTLAYRASPVLDSDGNIASWIGMDADVTEIKAIEADLRASNRELEAFSYSVSHDLRAPLAAIDGFSIALAEQVESGNTTRQRHYASRIRASVVRMGEMIDSLLNLAHVARQPLQPKPVNLSQIASSILAERQSAFPQRSVSVLVEPDLVVHGDPGLLAAAMENLLGNAWKFTSRRDAARIEVGRCPGQDAEPTFYVSDNGAGFDMRYGDKLFDTFQRLHSADDYPGTGVGLATVRRIVARHGGKIWAESQPGKGATFFISLLDAPPEGAQCTSASGKRNDSRFTAT